jgi:hypothetical protein
MGQISKDDVEIPFSQASGKLAVMRLGYIDPPTNKGAPNKKGDSEK